MRISLSVKVSLPKYATKCSGKDFRQEPGLNVNIPVVGSLSGIKVCRAARGHWTEEYDKRTDPAGHNYYWLTGHFHNMEPECEDTDEYLLSRGIATVVPVLGDRTGFHQIGMIDSLLHD